MLHSLGLHLFLNISV